jgi:hypothetical protein
MPDKSNFTRDEWKLLLLEDGRECVVADFETAGRSTARDDLREKPAL